MAKSKIKHVHFGLWESPKKCISHQTLIYSSRCELLGLARGIQYMLEHTYTNPHVEFSTSGDKEDKSYSMNSSRTYSLKKCEI